MREFLLGLYMAGLVMAAEGFLELSSAHGAIWWSSSGQRHVALGGLFVVGALVCWILLRKKQPKDKEPNKPS